MRSLALAAVVIAGGCAAQPVALRGDGAGPATSSETSGSQSAAPSVVANASSAPAPSTLQDCPDTRSPMEAMHPDQIVPEPSAPRLECVFHEEVRCVPPSPTTAAWQMDPFSGCPRTIPRWSADVTGGGPPAGFSRRATRAERLRVAGAGCAPTPSSGPCCYVELSPGACR